MGMENIPSDNYSDCPSDYSRPTTTTTTNCAQEMYALQKDLEYQDHAVTQRNLLHPKMKRILRRSSPWMALTAVLLMVVMTFFMCYLWRDLQQVELKHDKLATQIEMDHIAQENFLAELTEMMAEQEKTHLYSLEELEKKMKSALELMAAQDKSHRSLLEALEMKIQQAHKLLAEQQKTHRYTLEELEKNMRDALAMNGSVSEDQPKPKDGFHSWLTSGGATIGLPWRLAPLVSSLAILLLWQPAY